MPTGVASPAMLFPSLSWARISSHCDWLEQVWAIFQNTTKSGIPPPDTPLKKRSPPAPCPLLQKSNKGRGRRGGGMSAASKRFSRQFREDQARFSLEKGTNPTIARGRARLEAAPGTMELVKAMASFCPGDRPTMLEVLTHEAFAPLRKPVGPARGRGQAARNEEGVMEFMAFVRRDGDSRALPDV